MTPPLRVDKFLKIHLQDITGEILLFSSKIKRYTKRECSSANPPLTMPIDNNKAVVRLDENENEIIQREDDDQMAQENWRQKADKEGVYDLAEDGELASFDPILTSSPIASHTLLFDHSYCKNINLQSSQEEKEKEDEKEKKEEGEKEDEEKRYSSQIVSISDESKYKIKAVPKCKASKYFKPYPEIRQINLLTRSERKAIILPNGLMDKSPALIDGKNIFAKFTCGFDSLVHILMTAAIDDLHYEQTMLDSSSAILKFVTNLMKFGVTKNVLSERAKILYELGYAYISQFPKTESTVTMNNIGSYSMDCTDSIVNIVEKTLQGCPSVFINDICSACKPQVSSKPYIAPNHLIIGANFHNLEKALLFQTCISNLHCQKCNGTLTRYYEPNIHLLIDVDIREKCDSGELSQTGFRCKLTDLPTTINIPINISTRNTYRLVGVVAFSPNHFVAHCRRLTGVWELYNDLLPLPLKSRLNEELDPHLAIYVRQKD